MASSSEVRSGALVSAEWQQVARLCGPAAQGDWQYDTGHESQLSPGIAVKAQWVCGHRGLTGPQEQHLRYWAALIPV